MKTLNLGGGIIEAVPAKQYTSLNDASIIHNFYDSGDVEVWFFRPEFAQPCLFGRNIATSTTQLPATHIKLGSISGDTLFEPERVFSMLQGEMWSPDGEARSLIKSLGLNHTSMSTGDVVVANGTMYVVAMAGFIEI